MAGFLLRRTELQRRGGIELAAAAAAAPWWEELQIVPSEATSNNCRLHLHEGSPLLLEPLQTNDEQAANRIPHWGGG
jgi:hypothetical protein